MAEWISVNAKGITFDEFLERLPALFRKVAKRDRHLAYAPGSTKRKTRRELSPLWRKLLKAFKKLQPKA